MTGWLADACALIDFHAPGEVRMGAAAARAMASGEVHVAAITVWEIERKVALGKLAMPVPEGHGGSLPGWLRERGYHVAEFGWEDAGLAARLPEHHRDPMDRLLIAMALRQDRPIITMDSVFRSYGVRTLW